MRVLVADNASFIRKMLRDLLLQRGHRVVGEATDGQEAVSLYQQLKPDFMLLDLVLPIKDGLKVLQEVQELDPGAVVVICSALSQCTVVRQALELGAVDYVVKPFSCERLLLALQRAEEAADKGDRLDDASSAECVR